MKQKRRERAEKVFGHVQGRDTGRDGQRLQDVDPAGLQGETGRAERRWDTVGVTSDGGKGESDAT